MLTEKTIELDINGALREVTVPSNRTLLEALRELGHVEVKSGCEKGRDSCYTAAMLAKCTTPSDLNSGRSKKSVKKYPDSPPTTSANLTK